MQSIAAKVPELAGGSADLNPSTFTWLKGLGDFQNPAQPREGLHGMVGGVWDYSGRNIHFGVREHAMGAITVGMALHGGMIPYTATFMTFADYMRPPMRLAALMGIDVDRIIVITFAVGGALAGAAGFFYALLFRQVKFDMGFFPGLKAFTAAVLGGIGDPVGAMLGGMFLGIAESLFPSLVLDGLGVPAPYQLKDALAFILLVLVLIFRPTGILGERLAVKKA